MVWQGWEEREPPYVVAGFLAGSLVAAPGPVPALMSNLDVARMACGPRNRDKIHVDGIRKHMVGIGVRKRLYSCEASQVGGSVSMPR